jgi:hypothetical protein
MQPQSTPINLNLFLQPFSLTQRPPSQCQSADGGIVLETVVRSAVQPDAVACRFGRHRSCICRSSHSRHFAMAFLSDDVVAVPS